MIAPVFQRKVVKMTETIIEQSKKKAFDWFIQDMIKGLPLKWIKDANEVMLREKQDVQTERIKTLLDMALVEQKSLIFEVIDEYIDHEEKIGTVFNDETKYTLRTLKELKERLNE